MSWGLFYKICKSIYNIISTNIYNYPTFLLGSIIIAITTYIKPGLGYL